MGIEHDRLADRIAAEVIELIEVRLRSAGIGKKKAAKLYARIAKAIAVTAGQPRRWWEVWRW